MQIRKQGLSRLRQKLAVFQHPAPEELGTFLSGHPLIKGTVYTLRRKCFKASCRCARGERHETVVLTASINGKTRLWTIPADRIKEIRQQAQNYRRFRQARACLVKEGAQRQAAMLRLIDAIEKACTVQP
ncbi:MAG: DUF6788 family protein [Patescibacteria group bacterium]|mgnify:FL=1